MDRIFNFFCGVCFVGVLEMFFLGFLLGRDLGNKLYMG